MKSKTIVSIIGILVAALFQAADTRVVKAGPPVAAQSRRILSLNGLWQIAEGNLTNIPTVFARQVPVPGLVSLATPPFVEPGPKKTTGRNPIPQKDPRRDAFWYRRTFTVDGPIPAEAELKITKAMFGTRVFLNGTLLGDHAPSFTPGYFEAKGALKTGENELIVRVGADREAVGRAYPDGFDFEKQHYIPGIFDSVTLILSGTPHIVNVQVAPDITNQQARVRVWLKTTIDSEVAVEIREAKSSKVVGNGAARMTAGNGEELDVIVPIPKCHLWSPEDPFLYQLTARTAGDEFTTRFGMREFRFDPATRQAMLNGHPYFLRGSNFTLYRFFEDAACGDLPWSEQWVRRLHQRVKEMHWNCLRYCIGFPPEAWYEMADEEGILIEDEFPIWFDQAVPPELRTEELVTEYGEWMRERWNHPCVVIWDACNETKSLKTGAALEQVRTMDLSNRPWDNAYNPPQEPGDMFESHPYHFWDPKYKLANLATANPEAGDGKHATVINEYGWLWLNRDGTPTTLTKELYENLLGTNSTTAQRRHLYALYTAAETEFWRGHRQAAAVMQFTMLGYARADGQTSDNWLPDGVAKLKWEPEFYQDVRDAFAPVGMMIDFWNDRAPAGGATQIPVVLLNDLEALWSGPVTLRVKGGGHVLIQKQEAVRIAAFGTTKVVFHITWPKPAGRYVLETELRGADGKPVHSIRELEIIDSRALGLAYLKPATASSVHEERYAAANAVDGDPASYWSSTFADPAWLAVDLGGSHRISHVRITWENAYSAEFTVQVSSEGQNWTDVFTEQNGKGGVSEITFTPAEARHVRIYCTKRGTQWGHAIRELEVFE